ncbi:MAG: DUF302 domain-containing protein [Caulobacteraceae bacterium]|nr:DUF302 domain-containing protein [Caulobacteraceae bacterium]
MAVDTRPAGLIVAPSEHGPKETADRLVAAVTGHGMKVMARIDHAGAAASVGLSLRPTEVIIFGNPMGGTPLMQAVQTVGIDLPLKALVWQDEAGKTWVGYNAPQWIADRHGAAGGIEAPIGKMTQVLSDVVRQAAGRDPG